MGIIRNVADGLVNVVANLGTGRDKASHSVYVDSVMSNHDLLTAYRNSWLARAIIDYPAEDAARKWRHWRAKAEQITRIEGVENTLSLQKRVQDALTAARLYGGAAIYINTGDDQKDQPLLPGAKREIKSLVVMTPLTLVPGEINRDIESQYYGKPEFYTITRQNNAGQVRIHASRLVVFHGIDVPDDAGAANTSNQGWGDSVLQSTLDAIQQLDGTMANMASLVFEAKVDVLKFEGFAEMLANHEDEAVIRRLSTQAAMKGINGAVVIDTKDDYDQKTASFGGLPDLITKFQDAVSGAARIPSTRLYGRASAGLSGTGDGDERVYFDRIGHMQATEITPETRLLDELIIWQALGQRPADIFYEWAPLRQLSESERAEIFAKTATAARSIAGTNAGELIPMDALSDALVNELTEQGVLPGLDQAVVKYGSLSEQGFPPDNEDFA